MDLFFLKIVDFDTVKCDSRIMARFAGKAQSNYAKCVFLAMAAYNIL